MRLDDVCSHIVDCEHKTAPIDEAGEYFAVGTPAMRNHVINYAEARRISRETFETWTRRLAPRPGDLLLAREAPVGPVVRLPDVANVAPGQRTVLLRPDPRVADSTFLYYALTAPSAQARLQSKAEGSTVHHLNVPDIRSFELRVPALPEQQAIAEVLGALDDKIAANTALAARADDYLEAEMDRLTIGCGVTALGAIADVNRRTVKPVAGGSLRYVDIASVGVGVFDYPEVSPWDDAPGRARRAVSYGDTLWSTVRPNRRSHALVLDEDSLLVASTGLAVLSPREVGFAFLYEATRRPAFTAYLENVAEGSAYPAVRADRFLNAPVPDVSQVARTAFESVAAPLRKLVAAQARENRTLAATRDALLPQLMSGKLRVRDAEKIAADAGA